MLCVDLGFHVVIGVGRLTVQFHHAHAIPSFLLDVVVRLCPVIVNSDCSHNSSIWHIAKTGPLRCCPYKGCIGSLRNSMYFSGIRNDSSRHVQFDSGFHTMTVNKIA